jgi:aspartokinase-like uncharacterized kinase
MNKLNVRVVKVGGSLFSRGDLGRRLKAWLGNQIPAQHVLIAGGGELADVLRGWDELHSLGEERSHWLCIRALSITSSVLAAILPEAVQLNRFAELQSHLQTARQLAGCAAIVFDPHEFLRIEEPNLPPGPVPHNWTATTDSLAARLAEVIGADELALLKSVPPPKAIVSLDELAACGYVDKHFPTIAARLRRVSFQVI